MNNEEGREAENRAIAEELKSLALAQVLEPLQEGTLLLVPDGHGGRSPIDPRSITDKYLTRPRRKRGTSRHHTILGFVEFVNSFKLGNSVIFANKREAKLTAIFDYNFFAGGEAEHGEHRAIYECPLSDEWNEWNKMNDREMDQRQFAEFIEDRLIDVASPEKIGELAKDLQETLGMPCASPNKLLELSRGLSVRVGRKVVNQIAVGTGECKLQFEETHTDESGAPLAVPGMFLINIPVFDAGAHYQIAVRLRYRVREKEAKWSYQLHRPKLMLDHAFSEVVEQTQEATDLPLFFGTPERAGRDD